jgi:hypothetical protein
LNWRNVFVTATWDNSQISLSDISQQILMALQSLGYACPAVTTTALNSAQWYNGTFEDGLNLHAVNIAAPPGMTDDALGTVVSGVIAGLFMPLSTTPTVIVGAMVIDVAAAPMPGPPDPSAEPSPGNP